MVRANTRDVTFSSMPPRGALLSNPAAVPAEGSVDATTNRCLPLLPLRPSAELAVALPSDASCTSPASAGVAYEQSNARQVAANTNFSNNFRALGKRDRATNTHTASRELGSCDVVCYVSDVTSPTVSNGRASSTVSVIQCPVGECRYPPHLVVMRWLR